MDEDLSHCGWAHQVATIWAGGLLLLLIACGVRTCYGSATLLDKYTRCLEDYGRCKNMTNYGMEQRGIVLQNSSAYRRDAPARNASNDAARIYCDSCGSNYCDG